MHIWSRTNWDNIEFLYNKKKIRFSTSTMQYPPSVLFALDGILVSFSTFNVTLQLHNSLGIVYPMFCVPYWPIYIPQFWKVLLHLTWCSYTYSFIDFPHQHKMYDTNRIPRPKVLRGNKNGILWICFFPVAAIFYYYYVLLPFVDVFFAVCFSFVGGVGLLVMWFMAFPFFCSFAVI